MKLADLEARLLYFLQQYGRYRHVTLGMIGELAWVVNGELDFALSPRGREMVAEDIGVPASDPNPSGGPS